MMRRQIIVTATLTIVLILGCNTPYNKKHEARRLVEHLQNISKGGENAVSINDKLIALGESAIPYVILLLTSPEANCRINAAWILGEIGSQKALPALGRQLRIESDEMARDFQIQAVCSILKIPNNITAMEALEEIEEANQRLKPCSVDSTYLNQQ